MTAQRKELIARLLVIQNSPRNVNRDILTITGFMNDAQVEQHLAWEESLELERILTLTPRKAVA